MYITLLGLNVMCSVYIKNEAENSKCNNSSRNYVNINKIFQWTIKNDGKMPITNEVSLEWELDKRIAKKNTDISYVEYSKYCKRSCTIAVIDSDIDTKHRNFCNIWKNKDEVENDGIDNDMNGYVDDTDGWNFCDNNNIIYDDNNSSFHGTFVTGILCAHSKNYIGLLNKTQNNVMCIKTLNGTNATGQEENIIDAIMYAEQNGAKICVLSLATYNDAVRLYQCIKTSKMLFVVASANDGFELGKDISNVYPACWQLENIICVANIRCDGKLSLTSNYGKKYVDVAAPGTDIISTYPDNMFGCESGTSFAVPYVAGLSAMVYSCNTSEPLAKQIKYIICNNCTEDNQLKNKVKANGYISFSKTLNYLLK